MALLATQLDLEKYGHFDITAEPDASITARLESASAIIESYCGRVFTSSVVTAEAHDGRAFTLWLRQPPVTAVATVVENLVTLTATDYLWYPDGRLVRLTTAVPPGPQWWYPSLKTVTVTYTGGYNPVPFDVRLVCVRIAERAFKAASAWAAAPASAQSVESVTLAGSDSVTYSSAVTTSTSEVASPLTDEDRSILNPYRIANLA